MAAWADVTKAKGHSALMTTLPSAHAEETGKAFGAVSVTEVTAFEFNAPAVRDLCAADPGLRDELTARLFRVVTGRLLNTRTRLITRLHDTSPYAVAC
jgi:hypothetical protein